MALRIVPHADGSRVSIAIIRLCDSVRVWFCDSVCLFVCPRDKTKTAEIKIAKLGTKIVHQLVLGQKVKGQGHRVKKSQ